MEIFYKIVAVLGGLSLFLYGMRMMGDELKKSSGGAMKVALAKVTNNPALGFIFGMLVTCMIQSSTATIVLTVGLVGAGFLTFRQSIGIVLGANVGTAITAQIIRLMDVSAGSTSLLYFFKADNLAPVALIIGVILVMFLKDDRFRNVGAILIGFGVLFMGLIFMSDAVSEMGEGLSAVLMKFEGNYILGFLSGVGVTALLQSSSAVVGILQSMASSVGVRFCGVFAVIIGVNIGDCLTTFLVSRIGAKPNQIRTALVHVIYNICAATMIIVVLTILRMTGVLNDDFWYKWLNSGGVANVHGAFRLIPAVILLPFSGVFARLAERIVPDKPVEDEDAKAEELLRQLDSRLITSPVFAFDQATNAIIHMEEIAVHNFEAAIDVFHEYDTKRISRIHEREDLLDRLADASNQYIVDISPYIDQEQDSIYQSFLIKALNCYERIGDHALNLTYSIENLHKDGGNLSDIAKNEFEIVTKALRDILKMTGEAFRNQDLALARHVEPVEEVIDALVETLRSHHIRRMTRSECEIYSGLQFENMLTSMERISDQCSDLALFIVSMKDTSIIGNEHQYIHDLHHSDNKEYQEDFQNSYELYYGMLGELDRKKAEEEEEAQMAEAPETFE
ncbi:MAG: Na/Pi cotransporter family protein [Eubacterium sp.]|nr:Na/Pi cotransporter family protein [Eubacterium sp.]